MLTLSLRAHVRALTYRLNTMLACDYMHPGHLPVLVAISMGIVCWSRFLKETNCGLEPVTGLLACSRFVLYVIILAAPRSN